MNKVFCAICIAIVCVGASLRGVAVQAQGSAAANPGLEPLSAFPKRQLAIRTASGQVINFLVWIADTPRRDEQGLMFVKELDTHAGMLFEFPGGERVTMWMKNTYIPLDMLFINAKGRIDYIEQNTKPQSLDLISSPLPASQVLELRGGATDLLGIHVGDMVVQAKPTTVK